MTILRGTGTPLGLVVFGSLIGFQGTSATRVAYPGFRPKRSVPYEPMFVLSEKKHRLADGIDLVVELSTLGEYGFLPPEEPASAPRRPGRSCEGRSRAAATRDPLADVPRTQVIGALRTPRLRLDSAA